MLQAVVFMSRLRWKLPEPIRSEVTFRESRRSTLRRPPITGPREAGSVPRKKDNPALPALPAEQIESTQAAYDDRAHSGSSIALVAAADRQHGASNIGGGVRREEEDGGRHFTQEAISPHMT